MKNALSRTVALSVRQPCVELILRGRKTIEVRSIRTHKRGEVLIYASKGRLPNALESELAARYAVEIENLPRGLLVGAVTIVGCSDLSVEDSDAACFAIRAQGVSRGSRR